MLKQKISRNLHEYKQQLENFLISSRLLPGSKDYQKFVIICNIRTGSTMLTSMLSSHLEVIMFFELFHRYQKSISFSVPGYRSKSRDPKILDLRNTDPVNFMETEIYQLYPPKIKAVGFKLLYPQARADNPWWNSSEFDRWWKDVGYEPSWGSAKSDLWRYLKENKDIKIIHLKRQNLLESKISAVTAQQTGHWGEGATGGLAKVQYDVKFELDFDECLQDFEAHRRMEDETDELFKNHSKMVITYEQIIEDFALITKNIQEFLGLKIQNIYTITKKQSTKPPSEIVLNYVEIKRRFLNTPWSEFFIE
jgi:LPS sulfotransferase NodH